MMDTCNWLNVCMALQALDSHIEILDPNVIYQESN